MKMTMSHRYLSANLDLLETLGFPKAVALNCLGIDKTILESSADRMHIDPFVACINAAAEYTSSPNIALRLGHKFRVGSHGRIGNFYAYCKNLSEVVEVNDRYQKVAIDVGRAEMIEDPNGRHHMCFRPYYTDIEKYRPITDIIMASYMTNYSWLSWGSGEDILSTQLPYPRPKNIQAHEDIFRSELIFGSENICLGFSASAKAQVFTTHDPEKLAQAKMKLDKILGLQMAAKAFDQAVDVAIRGALDTGQISAHIVADRLGVSWSVLRTRLNSTSEGFRPRLDRIRQSIFMEESQAGRSLTQIANALAYNDQPAMNRAFKRWFDMTPSQWRKLQSDKAL